MSRHVLVSGASGMIGTALVEHLTGGVLPGIFGDMARSTLLASGRVLPHRLQESGYRFYFPDLPGALQHLLG